MIPTLTRPRCDARLADGERCERVPGHAGACDAAGLTTLDADPAYALERRTLAIIAEAIAEDERVGDIVCRLVPRMKEAALQGDHPLAYRLEEEVHRILALVSARERRPRPAVQPFTVRHLTPRDGAAMDDLLRACGMEG